MKVRFLLKQAFLPYAIKGKKMFWALVVLGVYVGIFVIVLGFKQEWCNDHWLDLAAGSWFGTESVEEEKLPPGIYTVSWPRIEWS